MNVFVEIIWWIVGLAVAATVSVLVLAVVTGLVTIAQEKCYPSILATADRIMEVFQRSFLCFSLYL